MDSTFPGYPNGDDSEGGPPPPGGSTIPMTGAGESGGGTSPQPTETMMPLRLEAGVEPLKGYTLVRLLGSGGFGEVWEALAPGGVPIALKFIRLDTIEAGLEQRALEVIRNIRHPHLLDVQFAVRVADCLVIAMPLCERSLWDRLHKCQAQGRSGLPHEELLGYMDDLAQALDFLNETRHTVGEGGLVGVQHRDIKPHNIFLVGGSARLADFGLAKKLEASYVSHSGAMSPCYAAPEMLDGKVFPSTDQFLLAETYCQLRTGRLPFGSLKARLFQPPDLSGLPAEERKAITRALAIRPDERWSSCREFVGQLKKAALADPDANASTSTSPSGPKTNWPRYAGLGGLAVTFCLAAVLYVTLADKDWRKTPAPRPETTGAVAAPLVVASAHVPKATAAPSPSPSDEGRRKADQEKTEGPRAAATHPATAAVAGGDPARVKEIFRTRCLACHGGGKIKGGVKVLDRDLLVAKEEVVPGKPDDSELFLLVTAADETVMPPEDQPRLGAGEVEAIRAWIAAGAAPFPPDVPDAMAREATDKDGAGSSSGVESVLRAILQDVRSLPAEDRSFMRYLSLAHLLTGGVTAAELDLHRAALAKAINHLSWEPEVVRPRPIDAAETVYRIDLRSLGWDARPFRRMVDGEPVGPSPVNLFDLALLEYPYGIVPEGSETFDQLAREFLGPAGQVRPIPYVRADWFVSTATLPPLYEDFLRLPSDLKALEGRLGVDARADIDDGRAVRAGMTVSDVSRNNRVVERHPAKYGAYWLSFDFRTSKAQENLFRDPIDLKPAGGEVIFHLPNGLQGYLLADAAGNRLEAAPTEIVTDKFAEDKVVRNGLSCIRCHDAGMKGFGDDVHAAVERLSGSPGFDRRKALRLYPGQAAIDPLLKKDAERFASALNQALGKPQAREPLIAVSQRYLDAPLSLPTAAAELETTPEKLQVLLGLPPFAGLGLSPLAAEGVIRRDTWEESLDRIVRGLGLGVPVVPLDALTTRDIVPAAEAAGFDVTLATSKKNNVFAPGDEMAITVTNTSAKALHIELIGTSARGRKVILAPSTTVVKPDQSFRFPPEGSIQIRGNLGKERITVFASDAAFPAGAVLHGDDVVDRVVHPYDAAGFDPARVLKKTIEIETR